MRLEHSLGWKLTVGLALALPVAVGIVAPTSTIAEQSAPATSSKDVTFSRDIAPILQRSCQNCHRPDGVAPMALVTYEDVRPWARAIKPRNRFIVGAVARQLALKRSWSRREKRGR